MNATDKEFHYWLEKHGGTGVFVRTKESEAYDWSGGGNAFMARGEIAPFNVKTIKRHVSLGLATQDGKRVTLLKDKVLP